MNGNNNDLGSYAFRIFIYVLGIFQAAFYTPVVLSFTAFAIIIPMLFQKDFSNPLFRFFPNGSFTTVDILTTYGKYAFGLSLLVAFAEIAFKRRLTFELKKKALWLGALLLGGYCLIFIFLIAKAKFTESDALIVVIPFCVFAILSAFLNILLSALTNFLNKIFAKC